MTLTSSERGLTDPAWRDRLAAQVPNLFDDALEYAPAVARVDWGRPRRLVSPS